MHSNFFNISVLYSQSEDSCVSFNFLADPESQQKVMEEMKKNNVKPNDHTYSELMKTYIVQ